MSNIAIQNKHENSRMVGKQKTGRSSVRLPPLFDAQCTCRYRLTGNACSLIFISNTNMHSFFVFRSKRGHCG